MSSKHRLATLWINYNSEKMWNMVEESLLTLLQLDAYHIIIDNGSSDKSRLLLRRLVKSRRDVKYVELNHNIGFSGALNYAYRLAKKLEATYLLAVNNDAIINVDAISKLVETCEQDKKIIAVSGIILNPRGKVCSMGVYVDQLLDTYPVGKDLRVTDLPTFPIYVTYCEGCIVLYNIELLRKIEKNGTIVPKLGFAYFDDDYIGYVGWSHNYKSISLPIIVGVHYGTATFRELSIYWGHRAYIYKTLCYSNLIKILNLLYNARRSIIARKCRRYRIRGTIDGLLMHLRDRETKITLRNVPHIRLSLNRLLKKVIIGKMSQSEKTRLSIETAVKYRVKNLK